MKEYEKELKSYFEDEVNLRRIPPVQMPEPRQAKNRRFGENIFLAACILGSLILIAQPAIYDNKLRRLNLPMYKYESFKEQLPRVIFNGFQDMKNKKGVKND